MQEKKGNLEKDQHNTSHLVILPKSAQSMKRILPIHWLVDSLEPHRTGCCRFSDEL